MNNQLKEKYGLLTAIAMVVGIVIGSGVFFKAEKVLTATGGDLPLGILAWALGGIIMIICAYTFSVMANQYRNVNGLVDYAEATVGSRYAYYVAWFSTFVYYPSMTSVLAWVSARYLGVILGFDITGGSVMVIACFFLIASYAVNALSPKLAGKLQVSTTVIKFIPLALMAAGVPIDTIRARTRTPCRASICRQSPPAMHSGAVRRPEKCPPPRRSSYPWYLQYAV